MINEQEFQALKERVEGDTASHEDIMLYINIMKEAVEVATEALKKVEEISQVTSKVDQAYGK